MGGFVKGSPPSGYGSTQDVTAARDMQREEDERADEESSSEHAAVDTVVEALCAKSMRFQYVAAAIAGLCNASDAVEVL